MTPPVHVHIAVNLCKHGNAAVAHTMGYLCGWFQPAGRLKTSYMYVIGAEQCHPGKTYSGRNSTPSP